MTDSERLIDELWGDHAPARARESLQMHVSRLRKAVTQAGGDAGALVARAGGYLLDIQPGARDVDRWNAALARARRARGVGALELARGAIDEALALWRGPPFEPARAHGVLRQEGARLQEEHLAATIDALEMDLELGRHDEVLGRLDALVLEHPFKERLVALQMIALYRAGRQAEALEAFRAARALYVEELGIEPGDALRKLHEDVLRHASELSPAAAPAPAHRVAARGLPAVPNRTIGRRADIDAIARRLATPHVRLLTLTGPGGVGKTRLALEVARRLDSAHPDGARLVSLAPLERADDVASAIVQALGTIVLGGESPSDALERHLGPKRPLLVLDNFEHVLAAAPLVGRLLERCPMLTVLATSREPLGLQAELCYPVSPLAVPEPAGIADAPAIADGDAVALFCERAQAHDPGFDLVRADAAVVASICRRLDGLPLAIEVAAARSGMLSAREIEQRLEALLGDIGTAPRDAPERHRTLRATIDWSHALLDADEKACFARFSLFAGGATVHAAETVTQARLHTLEGLVAKSMLVRRRGSGAPTRLRMLETIRTYAGERLTREADVAAVRDRYLEFYLGLARRHGGERALWAPGAGEHLAALDADVANLHAALEWAIASGDAGRALTFCDALGCYWQMRGRYADAVDVVGRALDLPEARAYPVLRVRALRVRNAGLWLVGRASEQRATLAEAESVARTVGDPSVLSRVLQDRVDHEATRDAPLAARIAEEAVTLARSAGDDWVIAQAYRARAGVAPTIDELRSRVEHAASLLTGVGNVYEVCKLLGSAAYAALWEQRDRDAKQFAQAALIAARAVDDAFTWLFVQGNFGLPALLTGDTEAARRAFREELRLCGELVARPFATEALRGLAGVACVDGDLERAARLAGAATALRCGQEDPVDARIQSLFFDAARARVGTRAWDAAAREGAALSFVAAVAYGLEEDTATAPPRGTA